VLFSVFFVTFRSFFRWPPLEEANSVIFRKFFANFWSFFRWSPSPGEFSADALAYKSELHKIVDINLSTLSGVAREGATVDEHSRL